MEKKVKNIRESFHLKNMTICMDILNGKMRLFFADEWSISFINP